MLESQNEVTSQRRFGNTELAGSSVHKGTVSVVENQHCSKPMEIFVDSTWHFLSREDRTSGVFVEAVTAQNIYFIILSARQYNC